MIALQFAMAVEAAPLVAKLGATFTKQAPYGFQIAQAALDGTALVIAVPGAHPRFGVDSIGSVAASLLTNTLIDRYQPRLLINAGTAGGFEARGGAVGDVYLGTGAAVFHDRRIQLAGFDAMGPGHYPLQGDAAFAQRVGLKHGVVSSGDSLDCTPEDARQLAALGASVKEMEAAAVGWVCERRGVPLMLVKAITDLVDHHESTAEQFTRNAALAVQRLTEALLRVLPRVAHLGQSR